MGSTRDLAIVVGINEDKTTKSKRYRMVLARVAEKEKGRFDWKFKCEMASEDDIIAGRYRGFVMWNSAVENRKVVGKPASLNRFKENKRMPAKVILAQIVDEKGAIKGYKVAGYDGSVQNVSLRQMLAYGERMTSIGEVPVQNAIFIPATPGKKAHYKNYPDSSFISELIPVKKNENKYAEKPTRVNYKENENNLNKLEEIYTKGQIEQLRLGKSHGVDIRVFANPQLSAAQMKALREALENKINVRILANPEFTPEAISWYADDIKMGLDVKQYLNSKYKLSQIAELSLAAEQGLDISQMANINYTSQQMAEIRVRMENEIWKYEKVGNSSWK